MKKNVFCIFLTALLITGCSNSPQILMPYSAEDSITSRNLYEDEKGALAETFAKDLCVIPLDYKSKTDKNLTASSSLMFDVTNQDILYEHNIYERIYPASITKIFTAYVVLKHGKLNDTVTISKNATTITEYGAKLCGFQTGDQISVERLLSSFLIYSGNDAGIALAEYVAGSVEEFSNLMNQEIKLLGAVDTHFLNPHGLHDDNHYTTAYDIYLVFNELIKNQTFLDIINVGSYTAKYKNKAGDPVTKIFTSTNRYLNGKLSAPNGMVVVGGKTGTTSKAGSCLVLYSQDKNENGYISLVLKAQSGDDLFSQMSYLLKLPNK